jgi:predicted enzyme related to lactoylglutathione lyase
MPKIIHFEIPATDPSRSRKFYTDVFGWGFEEMPGMNYWITQAGPKEEEGINGAVMKRQDKDQPLTIQIGVSNIDASLAMIEKAGGTVVVPKTSIAGMGHFAYFKDPDGVIVGLWQHDKTAT